MQLQKNTYLSGIKSLTIALADQMTFSNVHSGTLQSFSYSGEFYEIPFTKDTGSFSIDAKNGAEGIVREKSASIFYPGITLDLVMLLDKLIGQKLVVGVLTREDQFFVLGTPHQPLRLTYQYGSGKALSDESGFEISFQAQSRVSLMKSEAAFGEQIEYTVSVEDNEGNPVEGASVSLDNNNKTTDSSGQVVFTVPPGDYNLEFTAEHYDTYTETVNIDSNKVKTIALTKVEVLYEVTVLDKLDNPISGATITFEMIRNDDGTTYTETVYSVDTDENGYASIYVEKDTYDEIWFKAYKFDSMYDTDVTIDSDVSETRVLEGTGVDAVHFIVKDGSDNSIENADVRLYNSEFEYDKTKATDANGEVEFVMGGAQDPGTYNWEITKSGYSTKTGTVQVDQTQAEGDLDIEVNVTLSSS